MFHSLQGTYLTTVHFSWPIITPQPQLFRGFFGLPVPQEPIARGQSYLAFGEIRRTVRKAMAGINLKCTNCTTSIPLWDTHTLCGNCRPCTAFNQQGCRICTQWDEATWLLYFDMGKATPQGGKDNLTPSTSRSTLLVEENVDLAQPAWYVHAQKEQMMALQQLITSCLPPAKVDAKKKTPRKTPSKSSSRQRGPLVPLPPPLRLQLARL